MTLLPASAAGAARAPPIDRRPRPLVEAIIRRGDSPHTRRAYAGDLETYAAWLASEGIVWDAVTPDDLDRYREWLAGQYARTTANRRLVVVRALTARRSAATWSPTTPQTACGASGAAMIATVVR